MIQVTVFTGEKQTINPDKIIRVGDHDEKGVIGAHIQFEDDKFVITRESRQEVARKVLEYKLASDNYRSNNGFIQRGAIIELYRLAGLDTNDIGDTP